MRFFERKLLNILIGFLALLGIITVIISVRISITMIQKKDQIIPVNSKDQFFNQDATTDTSDLLNTEKMQKYTLYFNGVKQEALVLHSSITLNSLFPFDTILKFLNINYNIFSSDDVLKTVINGKILLLKLGSDDGSLGATRLKLQTQSIAAYDHIMVPTEILNNLSGFETSIHFNIKEGGAFINYWPLSKNDFYKNILLFKIAGGMPKISGIIVENPFIYIEGGPGTVDSYVYCSHLATYIVKSGKNTYYINKSNYKNPEVLNVNKKGVISVDGRFLYWEDSAKVALNIFDVARRSTIAVDDYLQKLREKIPDSKVNFKLSDFKSTGVFTKIDFRQSGKDELYTFIIRKGTLAVEGKFNLFARFK